jgi:hypothetical protein
VPGHPVWSKNSISPKKTEQLSGWFRRLFVVITYPRPVDGGAVAIAIVGDKWGCSRRAYRNHDRNSLCSATDGSTDW